MALRLLLFLALLLPADAHAQVQLTWQQPANPGWSNCALSSAPQCLLEYILVDQGTGQVYVVPYGYLSVATVAMAGTHTYALWLTGIDIHGKLVMSSPPVMTTVKVGQ
jgi:hypothetical protein